MNKQKKIIISILAIILLVSVFYLVTGAITKYTGHVVASEKLDSFVECLSLKNVKLYGAFWCGHCQNQQKAFGKEGKQVLIDSNIYVECDPRGENSQSSLCIEKGIESYPTWEIQGSIYEGEKTLEQLSKLSGCKLN